MIRAATSADLWPLRRKPQRRVFLYTPEMLASSYRAYMQLLRGLLGPLSQECVTLVLRDGGLHGILQAQRRSHAAEIDLVYLNAYTKQRQRKMREGDIWFRLVEDLLRRAGERRIERAFAAVGTRFDDVAEVLRQLGFQPYTQQRLWMLPEPSVETGSTLTALRRQRQRDSWAVHQLYCSLAPRHVQQAEMRQSSSWDLARRRLNYRQRGWVLGDDHELTAHMDVQTGVRGHVVRPLIAPHLRQEAPMMIRFVLSQLSEQRPVFALIHSYQAELEAAFEALGFILRGEQTLFVKHLALRTRQPALLPGLRRVEPSLELAGPQPTRGSFNGRTTTGL